MGERVIIADDEPKPAPQVIIVEDRRPPQVEKVFTEKTTVIREKE